MWAVTVDPGWSAIGFGVARGASGSSIRALESAAVPKYFGTKHLGSIRGFVASISVGSTAFGPLLFATGFEASGSYTSVLLGSVVLPMRSSLRRWPRGRRVPEITSQSI